MHGLGAALAFLLAATAACLMLLAGTAKNALERKRTLRFCPSCGRAVRDCACRRR